MEVLYNYTAFEFPKMGIFSIDSGEWGEDGWINVEEERMIIGETDLNYIEKLSPSSTPEWVGDEVIERKYILPLGPHKSRLVSWVDTQLSIF